MKRARATICVVTALACTVVIGLATRADAAQPAPTRSMPKPTATTPRPGAIAASHQVVFRWQSAPAAVHQVRLQRDPRARASWTWRADGTALRIALERGRWYWKVRSARSTQHARTGSWSRWSTPRRLTVLPRRDIRRPSAPRALTAHVVDGRSARVEFGPSRDDVRVVAYEYIANNEIVASSIAPGATIVLDCSTSFVLRAQAVDTSGNRSLPSPAARVRTGACTDQVPPPAPRSLRVTDRTTTSVRLEWTQPDTADVAGWVVHRDGVPIGGSMTTTFTASGLTEATTYEFTVRTRDRAGNRSGTATRIRAATQRPEQTTGNGRAWVLTSAPDSFASLQAGYRHLAVIYPTYFGFDASGNLLTSSDEALVDERVTTFAQARGVRVLPRVMTQRPDVLASVLTDPVRRERLAASLAAVANHHGYDGIALDVEVNALQWDEPTRIAARSGMTELVRRLAGLLHAQGLQLTVAVAPNWCHNPSATAARLPAFTGDTRTNPCSSHPARSAHARARGRTMLYDVRDIVRHADEVFVMAWGLHWSTGAPGANVELPWLDGVSRYTVDLLAHGDPGSVWPGDASDTEDLSALRDRVTIGTPLYGMDWSYRRPVDRSGAIADTGSCAAAWWTEARRTSSYAPLLSPRLVADPIDDAGDPLRFEPWRIDHARQQRRVCLTRPGRAVQFDPAGDQFAGNDPVFDAFHRPVGDPWHPSRPWGAKQLLAGAGAVAHRDPGSAELVLWHAETTAANPVQRQLWFADAETIRQRRDVIRAHRLRMGVWRLGAHDGNAWAHIDSGGS